MKDEVCSNTEILRHTWEDYPKVIKCKGVHVEFSLAPLLVADHS